MKFLKDLALFLIVPGNAGPNDSQINILGKTDLPPCMQADFDAAIIFKPSETQNPQPGPGNPISKFHAVFRDPTLGFVNFAEGWVLWDGDAVCGYVVTRSSFAQNLVGTLDSAVETIGGVAGSGTGDLTIGDLSVDILAPTNIGLEAITGFVDIEGETVVSVQVFSGPFNVDAATDVSIDADEFASLFGTLGAVVQSSAFVTLDAGTDINITAADDVFLDADAFDVDVRTFDVVATGGNISLVTSGAGTDIFLAAVDDIFVDGDSLDFDVNLFDVTSTTDINLSATDDLVVDADDVSFTVTDDFTVTTQNMIINGESLIITSTYTPTWSQSGAGFTLNNGSVIGRYLKVGEMVWVYASLLIGNTTAFGTGTFRVTLPFAPNSGMANQILPGSVRDNSADLMWPTVGRLQNASPEVQQIFTAGALVTQAAPITLAANDRLVIEGWYRAS